MLFRRSLGLLGGFASLAFCHSGHEASGLVQFCKDELFCLAQTSFLNPATENHDLYITLQVNGFDSASSGWTAVGLGQAMEGALMLVVYGHPSKQDEPTLSVRTTMEGHHPPLPFVEEDANGAQVQLVYAKWVQIGSQHSAELNIVVYNATRWPGTTIDASAKTQPWIWANNPNQGFEAEADDALLKMHVRDETGFGFFFVDMEMSVTTSSSTPSFPEVRPKKGSIGAATESSDVATAVGGTQGFRRRAWQVHGFLLTIAFLALYPLGVVLLRRQGKQAFRLHWIVQLCATLFVTLGVIVGIYLHPEIEHWHQIIGITLFVLPFLQSFLGWRHHVIFADTGRRTMFSTVHINLGRVLIGLGAVNVLLGMILKHWNVFFVLVVAGVIVAEAVLITMFNWRMAKRSKGEIYAQLNTEDDQDGVFTLDDVSSPDLDDDDFENPKATSTLAKRDED